MSWRKDSSAGAFLWDTEVPRGQELLCRNEELKWLMQKGRKDWSVINGRLRYSGQPTALEGTYGGLLAYPLPGSLSAVTLSASEQLLVPSADLGIYMPIVANSLLAPSSLRIFIAGRYTTSTSPGTVAITPRLGNAITSPSLGASATAAFTASLTNAFWEFEGVITVQSIGAPGTNSKAAGQFNFELNTAVGGATNRVVWGTGGTAASFDSTISPGTNGGCLTVDITGSATTPTMTVDHICWMAWN